MDFVVRFSGDPSEHVRIKTAAWPRGSGKPAADRLLRPVKPTGKRADFLRWCVGGAHSIDDLMEHFDISRQNVFSYLSNLHRDHGIGHTLADGIVTMRLPSGFKYGA